MTGHNILIYLVRHDLRVSDNPILHKLSSTKDHGFTHLIPLVVIEPQHLEVSGFLRQGQKSPYPQAKSRISGLWRCGPHRAKFIGESILDLKRTLGESGSRLTVKIGKSSDILDQLIKQLSDNGSLVGAVWTIGEEGTEEKSEEADIQKVCSKSDVDFQLWTDEKYFIDDRDLSYKDPQELPDVFTTYRKMMEPLLERPRDPLTADVNGKLPGTVDENQLQLPGDPFQIPDSEQEFLDQLLRPIKDFISNIPPFPEGAKTAHPFEGGESNGLHRLEELIKMGHANSYKATRNGLLGEEFSTKLSAYLAQGCITARQVHSSLVSFENGTDENYANVEGYGKGENDGTKAIRFELLWRDYMRLCNRKFKQKLFLRSGFRDAYDGKWKYPAKDVQNGDKSASSDNVSATLKRVFEGTTGMGFIDASQRELIHTGYTSNRARQNVASFLAKHLNIDWRYGAEYYEMLLVDYDVSSNWANWQYVAGVGNDPRGEARIFNPVKQAFDYDKDGSYVRTWVPEVQKLENLENVFQAWTTPKEDWDRFGLTGLQMAEDPVLKINFSVEGKPKNNRRPYNRRRGQGGRGGSSGSGGANGANGTNSTSRTSPRSGSQPQHHQQNQQIQQNQQRNQHQSKSPQQSSHHEDKYMYSRPYQNTDHQYYQSEFVNQGVLPPVYDQQRGYLPFYSNGGGGRGGYYNTRGDPRSFRGRGGYAAGYRGNYYGPSPPAHAWQEPWVYGDRSYPPW